MTLKMKENLKRKRKKWDEKKKKNEKKKLREREKIEIKKSRIKDNWIWIGKSDSIFTKKSI